MAMLARLALATLLVAAMLPSALGTSFRYKPRRPFRNSQGLPRGYYYWRPWPNPQDRPRSYYYNKKQAAAPARTEAMTPTTTFEEGSDGETWTGIVQVPKAVADQLFDKVPTDVLATALHVADRCRAELPGDLRVELATRAAGMRGMGELERACGDAKKNRLMAEMARSMPSWTKARLGRGLEACWRRMSEFQRQDEVGQAIKSAGQVVRPSLFGTFFPVVPSSLPREPVTDALILAAFIARECPSLASCLVEEAIDAVVALPHLAEGVSELVTGELEMGQVIDFLFEHGGEEAKKLAAELLKCYQQTSDVGEVVEEVVEEVIPEKQDKEVDFDGVQDTIDSLVQQLLQLCPGMPPSVVEKVVMAAIEAGPEIEETLEAIASSGQNLNLVDVFKLWEILKEHGGEHVDQFLSSVTECLISKSGDSGDEEVEEEKNEEEEEEEEEEGDEGKEIPTPIKSHCPEITLTSLYKALGEDGISAGERLRRESDLYEVLGAFDSFLSKHELDPELEEAILGCRDRLREEVDRRDRDFHRLEILDRIDFGDEKEDEDNARKIVIGKLDDLLEEDEELEA